MLKTRKVLAVLFSIILCISVAATIIIAGAVKTIVPSSIDSVVKSNPEYIIDIAENYVDIDGKLDKIFSSSTELEKFLEIIKGKGKTIDDVSAMLGQSVFSDVVSKYAKGLADYMDDSKTDIYVTEDEVKEALVNSRTSFELLLGDDISDGNWLLLSASFDRFAEDIVQALPEYSDIETEIFGDGTSFKESLITGSINGTVIWLFAAIAVISTAGVVIVLRSSYKWTMYVGVSLLAGGFIAYLMGLIAQSYTGSFFTYKILQVFALRAVSTINLISLATAIVGILFLILYLLLKMRKSKKYK